MKDGRTREAMMTVARQWPDAQNLACVEGRARLHSLRDGTVRSRRPDKRYTNSARYQCLVGRSIVAGSQWDVGDIRGDKCTRYTK